MFSSFGTYGSLNILEANIKFNVRKTALGHLSVFNKEKIDSKNINKSDPDIMEFQPMQKTMNHMQLRYAFADVQKAQ